MKTKFAVFFILLLSMTSTASEKDEGISAKYSMLFAKEDILAGGAITSLLNTKYDFLKWGAILAGYGAINENGPWLFNASFFVRFNHQINFQTSALALYVDVPFGSTLGGKKELDIKIPQTSFTIPMQRQGGGNFFLVGFNVGVVPGLNWKIQEHLGVFAEAGFSYHYLISPPIEVQALGYPLFRTHATLSYPAAVVNLGVSYQF